MMKDCGMRPRLGRLSLTGLWLKVQVALRVFEVGLRPAYSTFGAVIILQGTFGVFVTCRPLQLLRDCLGQICKLQ